MFRMPSALFLSPLVLSTLLLGSAASAHTAWLEGVAGQADHFRLRFGGHAGKLEPYDPAKLKSVDALDAQGKALPVTRTVDSDGVLLRVNGQAALIALHYDNGFFSYAGTSRSTPKPMNEVAGATRATHAVKYGKAVVVWSPLATRLLGQPFEVVPLDANAPAAGKPLRVRVLKDGAPVAGVKLGHGEEGGANDPVTDADGMATFTPRQGANKLWAGKRYPVTNDPRLTELSYEYLFSFTAD